MPAPVAVSEIEAGLVERAPDLSYELFPNGYRDGPRWRAGNLADTPPKPGGGSLVIWIDGAKAGAWHDYFPEGAGRDHGDMLWLIACAKFGGNLGPAVAWAKSWLHLDGLSPDRLEQHRIETQAAIEQRQAEAAEAKKHNRASARRLWLRGAGVGGTIVETYLRRRAIDLRTLGRAPGALRYGEQVRNGSGPDAGVLPAMLAVISNLDGEHIGTHRTFLKADGSGKATAADGLRGKAKQILGEMAGGHIPLWKGACGTMPLRDIPAGTDVYVSEGIEDGLTAACADPSLRVIAGVSAGNLARLELPVQIGRLIFIRQNDAADQAWRTAFREHRLKGRRVMQVVPPPDVKDLNELAQRMLAEAAA